MWCRAGVKIYICKTYAGDNEYRLDLKEKNSCTPHAKSLTQTWWNLQYTMINEEQKLSWGTMLQP